MASNLEYIQYLMEIFKEKMKEKKIEITVKDLGIYGLLAIVLSHYFSVVYGNWKGLEFFSLFKRTSWIVGGLLFIYVAYRIIKYFSLDMLNTNHQHHKELYFLLKDIETRTKFEK